MRPGTTSGAGCRRLNGWQGGSGADRRPALLYRSRQFGFASRLRVRAAGAAGRQSTACHRTPVQRRRPAPGPFISLAPVRLRLTAVAKRAAGAAGRQSTAFITCPCTGADRRPARSGPPSRSRSSARMNWRERNRCSGADRRPARSGPPSRSRSSARMNWRECKKFPVRAAPAEPLAVRPIGVSAKNSRSGPPSRSRSSARMNWRECKKFPVRAALAEPLAARPIGASAKKQATFAEIAFLLSQFRERESLQLSLELDFCWRNSASAKVYNFRWNCLSVIARPCTGADRRPAFRPPSRSHWPQGQLARAQKNTRESLQLSLELDFCWRNSASAKVCNFRWNWIFVGAIPRARKSTTFAGIGFLLAQFRERESLQLSLELDFCWRNSASAKVYNFRWNCLSVIARPCTGVRLDARPFGRPRGAIGRKANWRERKETSNFRWNWIFVGAIPRARKSTTFAGIGFLLAQFRERESLQLSLELLVCHRTPVYRRPTGRPAFRPPSRSHWPQGQLARAQRNKQLSLELDFCWRNSASAKVYNFRWNWIFVGAIPRARKSATFAGIACRHRTPVYRRPTGRPAFRPPSRSHWPQGQLARAQRNKQLLLKLLFCCRNSASAKVCNFRWNWIFVGAIPRARKSATFAGIGFLLSQFRERESLQLSLELDFCWRNSASAKVCNFRWNWIFVGAIPRARKSATFAGIACLSSHARVQASDWTPGLSAALAEPLAARPIGASAKKQATFAEIAFLLSQFRERESLQLSLELLVCHRTPVYRRPTGRPAFRPPSRSHWPQGQLARAQRNKQLLLELDFCWRNSASAKVCNFRWNCLSVIARPCTGVRLDARPFGRPRGAIGRKANWRERKETSNFC